MTIDEQLDAEEKRIRDALVADIARTRAALVAVEDWAKNRGKGLPTAFGALRDSAYAIELAAVQLFGLQRWRNLDSF